MRINHEVGCIHDTLAFLTLYVAESVNYLSENTFTESLTYYRAIREAVQSKVVTHSYLNPFFVRQKNSESFLYSIFFNRPYRECTFDRLKQILSNRLHMKKCFIAYCFPEADESTLNKLLYMEHPDVIDILTQRSMDIVQERNFIYILMNDKRACQELADVVIEVYSIIDAYRRSELPSAYGKALEQESVFSKLKAITGAKEVWDKDFTVSMSIMDANLFSFRVDERDFVLLGYDFEKRLDTDYKYSDVTLYSFAQAISSNPAKNDIFNALLAQSPMSSYELGMKLKLSNSTLQYNLNEMVKSRLVLTEQINKRTYNYSVNYDLLRVISSQLNAVIARCDG